MGQEVVRWITSYYGELDTLNERIMIAVQKNGNSYVSNAHVQGRFALRGCVMNYRTREQDMEIVLDDCRRAAQEVLRASPDRW